MEKKVYSIFVFSKYFWKNNNCCCCSHLLCFWSIFACLPIVQNNKSIYSESFFLKNWLCRFCSDFINFKYLFSILFWMLHRKKFKLTKIYSKTFMLCCFKEQYFVKSILKLNTKLFWTIIMWEGFFVQLVGCVWKKEAKELYPRNSLRCQEIIFEKKYIYMEHFYAMKFCVSLSL